MSPVFILLNNEFFQNGQKWFNGIDHPTGALSSPLETVSHLLKSRETKKTG
jgi:hypothetical protein